MLDDIFKNKTVDFDALIKYGFELNNDIYAFSSFLLDEQFKLTVFINSSGMVSDRIIDLATDEEYVLYKLPAAEGSFVGKIREEYEKTLADIVSKCFYDDIFKAPQAKRTIQYIKEKYNDKLEFLWKKFSDNAVVRRCDNQKWYAAFLTVEKSKIGLSGKDKIEVLDLRAQPSFIEQNIDSKTLFPGYHMNKKHWFTILFNDSINDDIIFSYIDKSYELAKKK